MNSCATLGKAALKSKKIAQDWSQAIAAHIMSSSTSRTFDSIDLPLIKPLCSSTMPGAAIGSTCRRTAEQISLLSVLAIDNGRVFSGVKISIPSGVLPTAFLGRNTMTDSLSPPGLLP